MFPSKKDAKRIRSRSLGRSAGPGVGYLDPLVRRGMRKGRQIFFVGIIKLSEYNGSLLSSAFTSTLLNKERQIILNAFPTARVQQVHCPRPDSSLKSSSIESEVRTLDAELARVRAFVLDQVAPLVNNHSDLTVAQHPLGMHPPTAIVFVGGINVIKELDQDIQSWQERMNCTSVMHVSCLEKA